MGLRIGPPEPTSLLVTREYVAAVDDGVPAGRAGESKPSAVGLDAPAADGPDPDPGVDTVGRVGSVGPRVGVSVAAAVGPGAGGTGSDPPCGSARRGREGSGGQSPCRRKMSSVSVVSHRVSHKVVQQKLNITTLDFGYL